MARPLKNGVGYFPQDADIHSDRKIRRLMTEFGAAGYLVYDYIKCQCYKENGYWVQFDSNFCFDVSDVLKCGTTEKSVQEILDACLRMNLFNSKVFNSHQIITSSGIQKRFLKIRKTGVIRAEIEVMDAETPLIYTITTENDDLSTQSKKESKVKERKVFIAPSANEVADYFKSNGYSPERGIQAHEYYATADWHDSHGKPVKNWKQKMQNWFKPENKIVTPQQKKVVI
jgi:hypothetical protein